MVVVLVVLLLVVDDVVLLVVDDVVLLLVVLEVEDVVLLVVLEVVLLVVLEVVLLVVELVLLVVDVVVQGVVQLSLFVQTVLQSYTENTAGLAIGASLKQKLYVVNAGTNTPLYPDAPHSLMVIDEALPVLFTIV